ncbi:hypothetical protein M501DRAFT_1056936 [Patellaria atrata CBS 101060]|uniref:Uncharacterized protein n=1 Tax=Patellaria atrata CBS 101060 TaxID=1346257 RepID=A0A9P4SD14_9PEZI|nr:hypothetical protein M501DRAFT_1056936 [Patellaria atrata CBS 101060]
MSRHHPQPPMSLPTTTHHAHANELPNGWIVQSHGWMPCQRAMAYFRQGWWVLTYDGVFKKGRRPLLREEWGVEGNFERLAEGCGYVEGPRYSGVGGSKSVLGVWPEDRRAVSGWEGEAWNAREEEDWNVSRWVSKSVDRTDWTFRGIEKQRKGDRKMSGLVERALREISEVNGAGGRLRSEDEYDEYTYRVQPPRRPQIYAPQLPVRTRSERPQPQQRQALQYRYVPARERKPDDQDSNNGYFQSRAPPPPSRGKENQRHPICKQKEDDSSSGYFHFLAPPPPPRGKESQSRSIFEQKDDDSNSGYFGPRVSPMPTRELENQLRSILKSSDASSKRELHDEQRHYEPDLEHEAAHLSAVRLREYLESDSSEERKA